jgi:hypothetical protein
MGLVAGVGTDLTAVVLFLFALVFLVIADTVIATTVITTTVIATTVIATTMDCDPMVDDRPMDSVRLGGPSRVGANPTSGDGVSPPSTTLPLASPWGAKSPNAALPWYTATRSPVPAENAAAGSQRA